MRSAYPPVTLEVGNARTKIYYCPPQLQSAIWASAAYATDAVPSPGWRSPEADFGEKVWDGWIRLSRWDSRTGVGDVSTGLLPLVLQLAADHGCPTHVNDARRRPEPGCPDFPAVPLRDYQRLACDAAEERGRGVLDMPPRAGKTRTGIELTRRLWLPTIWIAPTTNIVEQTVRAFDDLCGRNFAGQLVGTKSWRERSEMVHVMTAATAAMLPQEYFQTREVLLIDEVHHGASPQYHAIAEKADHIFYRFGMTGTFFRSGNDEVALHALLSNVIFKITTTELRDRGFIVPSSVVFLPIDGPLVKGGRGVPWMAGVGKHGIAAHKHRNAIVAWTAATLSAKGRKVLVLVATKAQGDSVRDAVLDYMGSPLPTQFKPCEFVSTDKPTPINRQILDAFVNTDEVRVLVGTSMVGEGTDLPSADAIVYAMGGKAEVSHRQAMFRVCTAIEGKQRAVIVDFADRHNPSLLQHSLERASTYSTEPTAETVALATVSEFPAWLDWISASRILHK